MMSNIREFKTSQMTLNKYIYIFMQTQNELIKIANTPMPFGKYKGTLLINLPETYVVWFHSQGFPEGHLGQLLGLLYEIKLNGLEDLVRPFTKSSL